MSGSFSNGGLNYRCGGAKVFARGIQLSDERIDVVLCVDERILAKVKGVSPNPVARL
jgi:hypothetical protein